MKLISFLLLFVICNKLHAQRSYMIKYGNGYGNNINLVFNDSMSYCYAYKWRNDPMKKSAKMYGEMLLGHDCYNIIKSDSSFATFGTDKEIYFVKGRKINRNWQDRSETKEILGYHCKSISTVNSWNDSMVVYYTEALGMTASPLFEYPGIPGVVLEMNYYGSVRGRRTATKIIEGDYKIRFPENVEIVTRAEHDRRNSVIFNTDDLKH